MCSDFPSAQGASHQEEGRERQAAFFQRMGGRQQFQMLFEHLPDVDFFAKDAEGRFVAANRGMLWRMGLRREAEILGLRDDAIHPPSVARQIRLDDLEVMSTRRPMVNRVEALFLRTQAKDWFRTTKLPVVDLAGEVIGIMGFARPCGAGPGGGGLEARLEKVVRHLQEYYRKPLAISALARLANLSARQLNRRFQEVFGMSPQAFLMRTRIQAVSEALVASNDPLSELAHHHGFCHQAALSRHFKNHVGETPLQFRQRRRKGAGGLAVSDQGKKRSYR